MESSFDELDAIDVAFEVSIPFKREGAWKAIEDRLRVSLSGITFQFPSNGKEHGKISRL